MVDLKSFVGHALAPLLFTSATVIAVDEVGPRFRRLRLRLDDGARATFRPGDKIQALLPDAMRTWTPFDVDNGTTFSLLIFIHGDTPSSRWARDVAAGQTLRFLGPQASLPLASVTGPAILVGDETCLAVAAALHRHAGAGARILLEVQGVNDVDEVDRLVRALGLSEVTTLTARRDDEQHLDAMARRIVDEVKRGPPPAVFLAGRAPAIQRLRATLKAESIVVTKARAYWAPGKRGLD